MLKRFFGARWAQRLHNEHDISLCYIKLFSFSRYFARRCSKKSVWEQKGQKDFVRLLWVVLAVAVHVHYLFFLKPIYYSFYAIF
jgi:hypothetical protein